MRKILVILLLSIAAAAQTGQVNHGGTGLNTSANDSILVGTGPNTYTLVNVPDCQDLNGNHLNFNAGTYTVTCGTSSTSGSGTPFQVTRYDSSGHVIQDSTGSDNPSNGPTRWVNGLSVVNGAGYRQFVNSANSTASNLLVCTDLTATTVQQVQTCGAAVTNAFGIADNGAGATGNVQVAMIGFHPCIFDGQTTINDYFGPSATIAGQCTDLGASKPNGVEVMGHVTTLNSGAGTLATVDLYTGDTIAPGGTGGSGTVSSSCAGVAYYPTTGTVIVGDCLFITDGSGHVTMYSLGLLDSTYAGFLYQKQGPLPPAVPANSILEFAPTSVTAYSIQKPSAAGTTNQCYEIVGTTTDTNGNTIDQMGWGSCSGGGGGSGTVTNVAETVNGGSSSGIFAVTGSPINTSGTLNINTAGTSGGVPYFSSGSVISSSAALTANLPVIGGGAGTAPSVGTRSGNTTSFGTTSGALTSGDFAKFDASGNIVDGGGSTGSSCPSASAGTTCQTTTWINDTITGTTVNVPVKLASTTANEHHVIKTQAADWHLGWTTGVIGICVANCGTAGNATIAYAGTVACQFAGAAAAESYVEIGNTGLCTADAAAGLNHNPELHQYFAKVHTTISGAGVTDIDIIPFGQYETDDAASSSNGGPFLLSQFAGSQMTSVSPAFMRLSGGIASHDSPVITTPSGWGVKFGNAFADIYQNSSNGEIDVDLQGQQALYGAAFRISNEAATTKNASHYSPPQTDANKSSGTGNEDDSVADTRVWTLTGTEQIDNIVLPQAGHISNWKVCQDGTGGRTFKAVAFKNLLPTIPSQPSLCTMFMALTVDATHLHIFNQHIDPVVATAQVAAITTKTLVTPQADSTWRITATLNCTTSSAAATVNITIGWTDTSNTAQTATLGSAVTCTTLGAASMGNIITAFRAKSGTNITYATAIANTPTYDLVVAPENLSAN